MRRVLLGLALAALAACRFPPFDPAVSLALLTADKLDRVGSVGPFSGEINEQFSYTFVPDQDFLASGAPLSGWVVAVERGSMAARYCWGGSAISPRQWGDGLWTDGADLRLLTATVAPQGRLLVMRFHGPQAWIQQLYDDGAWLQVQAPPEIPGSDFRLYVESTFADMAPAGIIGAGRAPLAAVSGFVELRFLSRDMTAGLYREGTVSWEGSTPSVVAYEEPSRVAGLPASIDASSYYQFCPSTGYAYLSVGDGAGGHDVYRWDHSAYAAELLPMKRRVEAVLSTGRLFCRDEESGFIHDPSGQRLMKLPMGDLEFVGEYWDWNEGRFRMVFVLPLFGGEPGEGKQTLSFTVYSWPTSRIRDLD